MKDLYLKHDLQNSVAKNIKRVKKDEKVVLGVSGGADSICLLNLLINILDKEQIIVVHLDHSLRKISVDERVFVEKLSDKYGVQCFFKTVDIKSIAADTKDNIEQCARKERYAFFDEIRSKVNAKYIITAHHKNDLAETIIMNILRGTSIHGLVGMKSCDGQLLRPILEIEKSEIINYCELNGLEWMEDESNQDISFSRNFIRNEIMPKLLDKYPAALDRISNLSNYSSELSEDIEERASAFLNNNFSEFKINKFKDLKGFLQKEVLVSIYKNLYGNKLDISAAWLDELVEFVLLSKNSSIKEFGHDYVLLKEYDIIAIIANRMSTKKSNEKIEIVIPSVIDFEGVSISSAIYDLPIDFHDSNCYFCYLDLDLIGSKIYVRRWQDGDKFYPLGSTGRKKLQDLFTDLKIPKRKRNNIPIFITEKNDIIWVGGYRIDDRYKITDETKKCLKLSIK